MARRRDHNQRSIQQHSQDTDEPIGKSDHQSIYNNKPSVSVITRVAGEAFLLVVVIAVPLSVHAGFFSNFFNSAEVGVSNEEESIHTVSAVDIPLLTALHNPNPLGARGGAEIIVNGNVLVSTGPVGEDEIAESDYKLGEIRVYTVKPNETLSEIAEMFGVTTNTIMWANDISKATSVQSGDTLVILPIAGVRHIVKSGDTISTIAKKYEGDSDEILSYNQLASAKELSIGDTLIIPGGAIHSAPVRASAQPVRVSGISTAGYFIHPAPGSVKSQRIHGYNAVDLASSYASSIRAAAAGEVIVSKNSGWNGGYGQYIVIRHSNGTQTLYAHLMRNDVGVGAYVSRGQVIGGMGSTGKSTGTHLHFEVRGGSNPF
ncbi:MAG: LysM repeat protein [Candidatus Paceibacteria bacterium]|jgi:LysM repeat protein